MKLFLLSFSIVFSFLFLNAQESKNSFKNHIISLRAGYSIPVASSQIGSPREEIGKTFLEKNYIGEITRETNTYNSRGSGLNFGLSYDYMLTENISLGIDFSYIRTLGINDASLTIKDSLNQNIYYATQNSYTSMFRATPMIGIYADKSLKIRPYAKFGIIIPFAGKTYAEIFIDDKSSSSFHNLMPIIDRDNYNLTNETMRAFNITTPVATLTTIEAETTGAFSIGFDAKLGAEYMINDKMGFFIEGTMQMLTVKANTTTITKFESGVDPELAELAQAVAPELKTNYTVDDIPDILKYTQYVDEINLESNNSYNNAVLDNLDSNSKGLRDKPFQQLGFRNNYNAFGLLVGFKIGF